jgi:tetratricopeptide (TPR) repeat protein
MLFTMKKILVISIFLSFLSLIIYAQQPTNAEIDKMMKEAQAKMEKMKNDPAIKETMKKVQGNTGTNIPLPGNNSKYVPGKFPSRNTALLNTLPKNIFTKQELLSFLISLHGVLLKKLNLENVKAAQKIITNFHNDPAKIAEAAIIAWYKNAPAEAALLSTYAASKSPEENTLNNCGAILNLCGLEEKAIPILKYALQQEPNSSDLLNNLGQAYTGLGETDTAMVYFSRCFQNSPNHPEANNTAGQIENSKGNTNKAKEFLGNSLKGAYNDEAAGLLHFIDPKEGIYKYIRPHVRIPEYFNENKYKLPEQCTNVGEAAKLVKEYEAFKEMIYTMQSKYLKLKNDENKIAQQTIGIKAINMAKNHSLPPFQKLASIMLIELGKDYGEDMEKQIAFNREFEQTKKEMGEDYKKVMAVAMSEFEERLANSGEGHPDPTLDADICNAKTGVNNNYLKKSAMLTLDWQTKNINTHKKYINDLIYWNYLQSVDIHEFRVRFYDIVYNYLSQLSTLCQTKFLFPCEKAEGEKENEPEIDIKEPECPIDVEFPFIVAKISINCERFEFEGGEGIVLNFEQGFHGRQSSIAIGPGVSTHIPIPIIKKFLELGIKGQLFIKFNGNNRISDGGLKMEAEFDIKGLSKPEMKVGWELGVNSGLDLNDGPLKRIIDGPPEKQINKNVKLFK